MDVPAPNWQQEIAPELLYHLITGYDQYIQQASKNGCYKIDHWVPLNIEEFYQTEFKLLIKDETQLPSQGEENTGANNTECTSWSTFSKHEILAAKPKPWWLRWLPW